MHMLDIAGTYKNRSETIELYLSADGTALITVNNYYRTTSQRGYWREKAKDYPIEIEFSKSFEITIGYNTDKYCRTLYLYDDRLWTSMSAIRSYDTSESEYMLKKE